MSNDNVFSGLSELRVTRSLRYARNHVVHDIQFYANIANGDVGYVTHLYTNSRRLFHLNTTNIFPTYDNLRRIEWHLRTGCTLNCIRKPKRLF